MLIYLFADYPLRWGRLVEGDFVTFVKLSRELAGWPLLRGRWGVGSENKL